METADTTCALSGSISGAGKSIEIRLRMCGPPLYIWDTSEFLTCLIKKFGGSINLICGDLAQCQSR